MSRESQLVETLVTLADTLVDDYDVVDFAELLAQRCTDLLDVTAAGIMLSDATGRLRHLACSNEEMRLVELFELQIEEGPCFDAFRRQEPVVSGSANDVAMRWPRFAKSAGEHGFVAVTGIPMRLRDDVIGALNLFSTRSGVLGDDDVRVAQAMADVATIGILQERAIHQGVEVAGQLEFALQSRIAIEQAKGIVAERCDISVDDAFNRIRSFARSGNQRLSDVARHIIDGALDARILIAHE
jgi:transcriptional regulator with GAF, ATPase, and Fis domain